MTILTFALILALVISLYFNGKLKLQIKRMKTPDNISGSGGEIEVEEGESD